MTTATETIKKKKKVNETKPGVNLLGPIIAVLKRILKPKTPCTIKVVFILVMSV